MIRIKLISVGHTHAAAVNSYGRLLTWGTGKRGQLGHKDINALSCPLVVESCKGFSIIQLLCHYNFTALLTCINNNKLVDLFNTMEV